MSRGSRCTGRGRCSPGGINFEAYAPEVFDRAGALAGASGFLGCGAAIGGSLWRARQARFVTTYGSACWASGPDFQKKGAGHKLVSLSPSDVNVVQVDWLSAMLPLATIALRTNGLQSHIQTVAAGEAMAALPWIMGGARPDAVRFETPVAAPSQPVKIGMHADMRDTPRIRA